MVSPSKEYIGREMAKIEGLLQKRPKGDIHLDEYSDAKVFYEWKSQLLKQAAKGTFWFRQYLDYLFEVAGGGTHMASLLLGNDPQALTTQQQKLRQARNQLTRVDTYKSQPNSQSTRDFLSNAPPLPKADGSLVGSDLFEHRSLELSLTLVLVAPQAPVPLELIPLYDDAIFHIVKYTTLRKVWHSLSKAEYGDQLISMIVDKYGKYTPLMALRLLTENRIGSHLDRLWAQVYDTQMEIKYGMMMLKPDQFNCVLLLVKMLPDVRDEIVHHLQLNNLSWLMWNVCSYMDKQRGKEVPRRRRDKNERGALREMSAPPAITDLSSTPAPPADTQDVRSIRLGRALSIRLFKSPLFRRKAATT